MRWILLILLCSCAATSHRQGRFNDSTIVVKDTVRLMQVLPNGDTVRNSKKEVFITHTPPLHSKPGFWLSLLAIALAVTALVLKILQ